MSWTKKQLILRAFGKIGLASHIYDIKPEELEDALYDLDAIVAEWAAKGVRIGYPLPSSPHLGDIDDDTGIPDSAARPLYYQLAMSIAPDYGKEISQDVRAIAAEGFKVLLAKSAVIPEMRIVDALSGAGAKTPDSPYFDVDDEELTVEYGGDLEYS